MEEIEDREEGEEEVVEEEWEGVERAWDPEGYVCVPNVGQRFLIPRVLPVWMRNVPGVEVE